jgi:predicted nucleotidyltransferase
MNSDQHARDRAAVAALRAAVPTLIAVYRFGSSATGAESPESDIDLAILSTEPLDAVARYDLQQDLSSTLHRQVDLVDLPAASPVMAIQVISKGQLLYDANAETRGRFEDLTYGMYARLNEERRAILQRVAREGTVYGR